MRRMTGSQRKAKKKQRSLLRRKGPKQHITLYHGTKGPQDAHGIRQWGLKPYRTSPYITPIGTKHIYDLLTTNKHWASSYTERGGAKQVIKVVIPKKVAHKYLVRSRPTSRGYMGNKQANNYGLKGRLPSRYIK